MLRQGDFVMYPDGAKGRVQSADSRMVVVRMTDGTVAHLHPADAAEVLSVWRGDKRTGAWEKLATMGGN